MSKAKTSNERPSTPSSPEKNKIIKEPSKWKVNFGSWGIWIPVVVLIVTAGVLIGWSFVSQDRTIVKHTTVLGQDLGGLTAAQALTTIQKNWDAYRATPLDFSYGSKKVSIVLQGASAGDDAFVLDVATLDPVQAANAAYAFGHEGNILNQTRLRLSGWFGRRHEVGKISFASDALKDILHEEGKALEEPATNARLSFSGDTPSIVPSASGHGYDYGQAVQRAATAVRSGSHDTITIPTITLKPTVVETSDMTALLTSGQIETVLAQFPFTLKYNTDVWTISRDQAKTVLGFTLGSPIRIGFDATTTATFLATAAKDINEAPVEPKLVLENGKVTSFAAGTVGRSIDMDATIAAMNTALLAGGKTVMATVTTIQPTTSTADTNTIGITELVAEGITDFKGSPTNRRFNLSFGAKKLNGILIKSGETLSLVSTLGKIDGQHGWKPELVIKGSKITPEFGGGLCQVATTLFRSALNAGLPIVERTNHSLRISYYEPPVGLDATIYVPRPDLKFTNNYSTPLLVQTEVRGTKLIFRLYGTKDGRLVNLPTPRVFNKVGIPATKYIEVTTLKPGELKCQKPGHPGADAIATYTVTYADGTKKVQIFKSHYRAIGVICQVGKAAVAPAANVNTN